MTTQLERSSRGDDAVGLLRRRTPGWSLEAPFYTSREVFDLDVAAIFREHWLFVAAAAVTGGLAAVHVAATGLGLGGEQRLLGSGFRDL